MKSSIDTFCLMGLACQNDQIGEYFNDMMQIYSNQLNSVSDGGVRDHS